MIPWGGGERILLMVFRPGGRGGKSNAVGKGGALVQRCTQLDTRAGWPLKGGSKPVPKFKKGSIQY